MIETIEQKPLESNGFRSPDNNGVYFLKDVSRLLRATDHFARADEFSLSPQQISGWARRGFAHVEIDEVFSKHRFVRFRDLITLRMVAILRSHGVSLVKITIAHDYLKVALTTTHPFVNRALWVDDAKAAVDVYAKVDQWLVTASRHGQLPFSELLSAKIIKVANMTFDQQGDAITWAPENDVVIDPKVRSGASCLAGTRIATRVLYDMSSAGEEPDEIADWYGIDVAQVNAAIRWEERLAA